jgi:hypothetical protein
MDSLARLEIFLWFHCIALTEFYFILCLSQPIPSLGSVALSIFRKVCFFVYFYLGMDASHPEI